MLTHAHTGLDEVTDAGLKAFSAALASSMTITAVTLGGKCECLVCSYEWARVLLCMRVCSVSVWMWWCGVCEVHDECMLAPGRTSKLLGCGCWVGGAHRGGSY